MRVTIRDVAREAGTSVATVSRVLNDSGPVHAATRERVREIARRLRYSPSGAARSLSTQKTHTIGVLLPALYGEFFSEVIRGIDQMAHRRGYHLLVSSSHADRDELEAALRAMHGRVDGLLVMTPDIDAETLTAILPPRLPLVLINTSLDEGSFASVAVDNFGGVYGMVRHLLELGHRRIAIIQGTRGNHDAQHRLRGYRAALSEAGIPPDPALEIEGNFTEAAGHAAVRRVLALEPRPTAIFASNDAMAIGALSALREAGLRVPRDLSVVGFDDIPIARYMDPPLTSVHVGISELGGRATERLLEVMEKTGKREPLREVFHTTLVVRESCGPPPR